MTATTGPDTLTGGGSADSIDGLAGNDSIVGLGGDDTLDGNDGNDTLFGGTDNDSLIGGNNDDVLYGEDGNDTLSGGAGADKFMFTSVPNLSTNLDTIIGFVTGEDKIVLTGSIFNVPLGGVLTALNFGSTITGLLPFIQFDGTHLYFDADGVSTTYSPVKFATLSGSPTLAVSDIEILAYTFIGSSSDDTLIGGTSGPDILSGLNGNDNLVGNAGNDSLDGGAGLDTLDGGTGADTLVGGDDDDIYYVDNAGDVVTEASGAPAGTADSVYSSLATYTLTTNVERGYVNITSATLIGNALANTLTGNIGADSLVGGIGNDILIGAGGNDTLDGGDDADTLNGGTGDDSLLGGNGIDVASYADASAGVVVSLAITTAQGVGGGEGSDVLSSIEGLSGSAFGDILRGDGDANKLSGNAGNDTLIGEGGNDTLDGGADEDTADYSGNGAGVVVSLAITTSQDTSSAGFETLTNIENLIGTSFHDHLYGDANANKITSNAGGDELVGNGGNDLLTGGTGIDTIDGGTGVDTMIGAESNDTYYVDDINDVVIEVASGGTRDFVFSSLNSYTLPDEVEAGGITSTGAANMTGNALANFIEAGKGDNVIAGGGGIDTVSYANGVPGSSGVTVSLAITTGQNTGSSGTDTLTNIRHLEGTGYADKLTGNGSNNLLDGAGGNDTLDGGLGQDTLQGGGGNDAFVFSTLLSSEGGGGPDTLADFVPGTDKIQLSAAIFAQFSTFGVLANGDNFVTGPVATAAGDTNDYLIYDTTGTDGILYYDADGNGSGTAIHFATLTGKPALTFSSIEIVAGVINGTSADEALTGTNNADVLNGLGGNDTLTGGLGNDTLDGGADVDDVNYSGAASAITASLVSNTVTGGAGSDVLLNIENIYGSGHADLITGDSGNNYLYGDGGDDTLIGGAGNDTLHGGGGNDLASYAVAASAVTINLNNGESPQNTVGAGTDLIISIEKLIGSNFNDQLTGSNFGNETISGGTGNDTIAPGNGNDSIDGGDGIDTVSYLTATQPVTANLATGVAQISAGQGNQTLANVENLIGHNTHGDSLTGNSVDNALQGQAGDDTLIGNEGNDTLVGGNDNDRLYGNDGNDSLYGEDGDDTLEGGAGNDLLSGGSGTDLVTYENVVGGTGVKISLAIATGQVAGTYGTDTLDSFENLKGSTFNDTLSGDSANNKIEGNDGADFITGDLGLDTLLGGNGDDTLFGGEDNVTDRLTGGAGNDRFRFAHNVTGPNSETTDIILDFTAGEDKIQLDNMIFTALGAAGASLAGKVLAGPGFTTNPATATELLVYITDSGELYYNANGSDPGGDVRIGTVKKMGSEPENLTTITADDFEVVHVGGLNVTLTSGPDSQDGAFRDDTIFGGGGNDTLRGHDGNDSLDGGADNDTLDGGDGIDTLIGGTGVDSLYGGTGTDSLDGGDGNDTLDGGDGNDTLIGGAGNDTLDGAPGVDSMVGGADNDTYQVDVVGDIIVELSGEGTDVANVYATPYTLPVNVENGNINPGGSHLTGNASANNLVGNTSNDSLSGLAGNDTISGGAGDDVLIGGSEDDSISGGASNDTLDGGIGNDTLNGDADFDTVDYSQATSGVAVSLAILTAQNTGGAGTDLLNSIEHLIGSGFADKLLGASGDQKLVGGAGADTLGGAFGNDTLTGGNDADMFLFDATLNDTSNVDQITDFVTAVDKIALNIDKFGAFTTVGSNVVISGNFTVITTPPGGPLQGSSANNFLIYDKSGTDGKLYYDPDGSGTATPIQFATLIGSPALAFSDFDIVASAGLTVTGTGNNDASLIGASGDDTISGLEGNDSLSGGLGNDTLHGGDGNDTLDGGAGVDTMTGANGNDIYYVDNAGDIITESSSDQTTGGTDRLYTSVSYTLPTNVEEGGVNSTGSVNLTGNALSNFFLAGKGTNVIDGGTGIEQDTVSYDVGANGTGPTGVTVSLAITGVQTGDNSGGDTLISIEHLYGSPYNDALTGNDGNNNIGGGDGNDTLSGGLGDDFLYDYGHDAVDGGNDLIDGGTGTDTMSYSGAIAAVTANLFTGVVTGGAGSDTVAGIENLFGSGHNDVLTGSTAANVIHGEGGNDTISGGDGNDSLFGDNGNDMLTGGTGADRFQFFTEVNESTNVDSITDFSVADGDRLVLSNKVFAALPATGGLATTNFRIGTSAADSNDYLIYNSSTGQLYYDADGNGAGAQKLVATLAGAPALSTTSFELTNFFVFTSGSGNLVGTSGEDSISGGTGSDTISGGDGNDTLTGGGGSDNIIGGNGFDTANYSTATNNAIIELRRGKAASDGQGGVDTLSSIENLTGGPQNDILIGDDGVNVLKGEGGSDIINGFLGADYLYGGGGNDYIRGGGGGDYVDGGTGIDTADYSSITVNGINGGLNGGTVSYGSDIDTLIDIENIVGSPQNDTISGNTSANRLEGGNGNDSLKGLGGNDTILGGRGDDSLYGGLGNDELTGGRGADRFYFENAPDPSTNLDKISDFVSGTDKLFFNVNAFGFSLTGSLTSANVRVAPGATSAADADDFIILNSTTGDLWYDDGGNTGTGPVKVVTLVGVTSVVITDVDAFSAAL